MQAKADSDKGSKSFTEWLLRPSRERRQSKIRSKSETRGKSVGEKLSSFARTSKAGKRKRSALTDSAPSSPMAISTEEIERALDSFDVSLSRTDYVELNEQERNHLLAGETARAWDAKARISASETEKKASKVIYQLREHEREHLFGNVASEAIPGPETRDMGGQFLTNREHIRRSKIFEISRKAPKGAELHLHFNAELHPVELLNRAEALETMFIRSTQPLVADANFETTEIVFSVLPKPEEGAPVPDIFSSEYNPDVKQNQCWMPWRKFRYQFCRNKYCEKNNFRSTEDWIMKKLVLSEDEVYGKDQTVNGVWARFNQSTRAFKGLLNYEGIFRWYIGAAIDNMVLENVMYVEFRPMWLDKFIPSTDGLGKLSHEDQINIIKEELDKKKKELKRKGKLDCYPFGIKIIYSTPRSIPKTRMRSEIKDCIKLKLKYPDIICGFDLVGAEDRPNHIGFYREELVAMQETCKSLGIEIPFMFHAGETLLDTGGSRLLENSNLYEAVTLNSKRIGHGYSLVKHPLLIEEFKRKNICIELCPISNELLHLCRCIKEHPFPELLAAGIPCTLNSDNPSLFRGLTHDSNSLSDEFYQVMVGWPAMSLTGWRQLAEWSIEYSCLSDAQKAEGLDIHRRKWEAFCQDIVESYGAEAEKTKIPVPENW